MTSRINCQQLQAMDICRLGTAVLKPRLGDQRLDAPSQGAVGLPGKHMRLVAGCSRILRPAFKKELKYVSTLHQDA